MSSEVSDGLYWVAVGFIAGFLLADIFHSDDRRK
jgi:hypothetical protein